MNALSFLSALMPLICVTTYAEVLTEGIAIDTMAKAMKSASYQETFLAMSAGHPDRALRHWAVDEGVLSATYSKKSNKVLDLIFGLSDDRPRESRQTFDFEVVTFDTRTGLMTIRTSKDEPAAAVKNNPPSRLEKDQRKGKASLKPDSRR